MIKADKKRAVEMESYLANSMADLDSLADQAMDRIKTKVGNLIYSLCIK